MEFTSNRTIFDVVLTSVRKNLLQKRNRKGVDRILVDFGLIIRLNSKGEINLN